MSLTREGKIMTMKHIAPNTHPSWLQRYMEGFRTEIHHAVESAKEETDPERALHHVENLANHVETLSSIVHALVNHVALKR